MDHRQVWRLESLGDGGHRLAGQGGPRPPQGDLPDHSRLRPPCPGSQRWSLSQLLSPLQEDRWTTHRPQPLDPAWGSLSSVGGVTAAPRAPRTWGRPSPGTLVLRPAHPEPGRRLDAGAAPGRCGPSSCGGAGCPVLPPRPGSLASCQLSDPNLRLALSGIPFGSCYQSRLSRTSNQRPRNTQQGVTESTRVLPSGRRAVCAVCQLLHRARRCDPVGCNLPGSSVHGDAPGQNTGVGCPLQGSSQPRDGTQVSRIAGGFSTS